MKKIITYILSLTLTIFLILCIYLLTISNTILKEEYIKKQIKDNDYTTKVYNSISKELENYIPQLHIGEENISLSNIITKEIVKKDIDNVLDFIYNNKKLTIHEKEIKNELDIRINKELNKYNRVPTKSEEKTLEEIKNNIIKDYKNRILFEEKYLKSAKNYFNKIKKIVNLGIIILLPITLINIILIIIIPKKKKEKYRALGISLLATNITIAIIKYIIINKISHILILNKDISQLLIITSKMILSKTLYLSIILGIIGLIGIIIGVEEKE